MLPFLLGIKKGQPTVYLVWISTRKHVYKHGLYIHMYARL